MDLHNVEFTRSSVPLSTNTASVATSQGLVRALEVLRVFLSSANEERMKTCPKCEGNWKDTKIKRWPLKCFRNIMSSEFWPSLSRGDVSHLCFCDSHHATNLQSESTSFPSEHFSGRSLFTGIAKAFRIFVSICSVRPTFPTPTLLPWHVLCKYQSLLLCRVEAETYVKFRSVVTAWCACFTMFQRILSTLKDLALALRLRASFAQMCIVVALESVLLQVCHSVNKRSNTDYTCAGHSRQKLWLPESCMPQDELLRNK